MTDGSCPLNLWICWNVLTYVNHELVDSWVTSQTMFTWRRLSDILWSWLYLCLWLMCPLLDWRIYIVHDEVKDKAFELELSWVGEGKNLTNQCPAFLFLRPHLFSESLLFLHLTASRSVLTKTDQQIWFLCSFFIYSSKRWLFLKCAQVMAKAKCVNKPIKHRIMEA